MRQIPALAVAVLGLATLGPAAPARAAPPPNDNFASAQQLPSSTPLNVAATTEGATTEAGEPEIAAYGGTVWFAWTAPRKSRFRIANCSRTARTELGVYTGSSLSTLKEVPSQAARNHADDAKLKCAPGEDYGRPYRIAGTAGTTYYIKVQESSPYDPGGPLQLTIEDRPVPVQDLGIGQTQSRRSAKPGRTVTFTATLTNLGNVPADRAGVTLVAPTRKVRYVSIATTRGSCKRVKWDYGARYPYPGAVCTIGRLEPGQSVVVTAKVKLGRSLRRSQSFAHVARSAAESPFSDEVGKNSRSSVRTAVR